MSADEIARATELRAADLLALARADRRPGAEARLARRPGTVPTRPRGQGHEIREIRPFVPGDDPRHLDPAATARSGQLQLRSFHEDRDRSLFLIADFRRPMLWGSRRFRSITAAEALARAGWQAVAAGGSVGVAAITDAGIQASRIATRPAAMAAVAGCLARAHADAVAAAGLAPRPLAPDLARAARLAPRGAAVVLASALDDPGPGFDAAIGAILRRGPLQILLPADPIETAPPRLRLGWLDALGRAHRGRVDGVSAASRALRDRLATLGATVATVGSPLSPEAA
ncbi:DUF58 domain-containing protein [Frigidibacter sp. MR17.24]|uniref:DUF58 domain-containing protein n=1 Tax=Frigidibacter sp. MR17.24 TaxID=3127345 RepID=UPI003012D6DB